MQENAGWQHFKNILCIRPDAIGDVLMTTPAWRALKETYPRSSLTLLTSSSGVAVSKYIPDIDHTIECNVPWESAASIHSGTAVHDIITLLREKSFDAAIIHTVYSQSPFSSALICMQAGIPRVLSYSHETPNGLISDWLPDKEPFFYINHEVIRQLELVKSVGAFTESVTLNLKIPDQIHSSTRKKIQNLGVDCTKPFIVLHPGVREKKRQYSPHLFARAAQILAIEGHTVVITGTEAEKNLHDTIQKSRSNNIISTAGVFDIGELSALISLASVVVSNNTGPVHIAAAMGTPVVDLYALTNPQHLPWKVPYIALPFTVDNELKSRNTIIQYVSEKYFKPVPMPQPEDIVNAVDDVLNNRTESLNNYGEVIKIQ